MRFICPKCGFVFLTEDDDASPEIQSLSRASDEPGQGIINDYTGGEEKEEAGGIKKAVGKVSEYRERFKKRKVLPQELIAQRPLQPSLVRQDAELDRFGYEGESLFFGPGIEAE